MDKTGEEAASRFINALIKSVQTLCHGYLDFENGVEIIGHINLSVDRGGSLDYILKEKVCKNAENSTMFISNSFYAEPKPELSVGRSSWQADDRGMHQGESPDLGRGGSATFTPGSDDAGNDMPHYSSLDTVSSQTQAGPSGLRGVSGVQGFVQSLSAFGSMGGTALPLGQICGGRGGLQGPGAGYSKSHSSLQRAFALHSEDKRRKEAGEKDEEIKRRLELMSELLALKGVNTEEEYKRALQREKRRVAKKLYRAGLPEEKKHEIKEKDKLHKRLKRATKWAATATMTDAAAQFSHDSANMSSGKEYEGGGPPHSSPGSVSSYAGMSSEYVEDVPEKNESSAGRMVSESSAMVQSGGSESTSAGRPHSLGSDSVGCYPGLGSGSLPRLGPTSLGSMPRLGSASLTAFPRMGTDNMESFHSMAPAPVSSGGMVFGSAASVSWMDSMSFDTEGQEQRRMDAATSPRDGHNPMKLGDR